MGHGIKGEIKFQKQIGSRKYVKNHSNIELKEVEKNCETRWALQKKQRQIGEGTANEIKTDRQF